MREKAKLSPRIILFSLEMVLGLVFGMTVTAYAGAYSAFAPKGSESYTELSNKQVYFSGYPWYIIEDYSDSFTEGSLTLLAADTSFGLNQFDNTYPYSSSYNGSHIADLLKAYTDSGSLKDVANAINEVNLEDVGVNNVKLYLLSKAEAEGLPQNVRELIISSIYESWWLRSPVENQTAVYVDGTGEINEYGFKVNKEFRIRPALQLNLGSVIFSPDTRTFSLTPAVSYKVTFKVENGYWNEGNNDNGEKTVTLSREAGGPIELKLSASQIPKVGSKPASDYEAGAWNKSLDIAISGDKTFVYKYKAKSGYYSNYDVRVNENAEVVYFNNKPWNIIKDNSTSATEGTVTLLAADTSFGVDSFDDESNRYSGSFITDVLKTYTDSGSFKDVANAIKEVDLADVGVNGAKLYLLSTSEAEALPKNVRKMNFTGGDCISGEWWLRSPLEDSNNAAFVNGDSGNVSEDAYCVAGIFGIRPALQLDLSKVVFDSNTRTFSVPHSVTLKGGKNATTSGGNTTQTGLTGKMTTVTYTAKTGYHFEQFNDKKTNGITVKWVSKTQVTVSGKPTADTEITVPDAINTYTVTLNNQGATTPGAASVTATYNSPLPTIENNLPTKTDYSFGGYFSEKDGKGTQYLKEDGKPTKEVWTTAADGTIYAKWTALKKADTPETAFTATGSDSGTLSGVDSGMKYQIDGGEWAVIGSAQEIDLTGLSACIINVVRNGDGTSTVDSDPKEIKVTKAEKPTGLAASDCMTTANEDGKITGVTNQMQYMKSGASAWSDVSGTETEISGLVPGTYQVRMKPDGTTLASESQELTIKKFISATVIFKVVNGSWNEGEGDAAKEEKKITLEGYDGDTLKLDSTQIPAVGDRPDDTYKAGDWDNKPIAGTELAAGSTSTYTYTYVKKKAITATVTFKVESGSWNDETTTDKTVTLTGYEGDTLKLQTSDIPAVGNKPADTYKAGSWNTTPNTETAITGDVTYKYTYKQKDSICFPITFMVEDGSWNDGTTEDKTVELKGYEGDTLKLSDAQIPAVGDKPADTYKAGFWEPRPDTETEITTDKVYIYRYQEKDRISVTVTFRVSYGWWNDDTSMAKTVMLTGYEGDELKLSKDQIPSAGDKPFDGYMSDGWDKTPSADTAITENVTYTYYYTREGLVPPRPEPMPTPDPEPVPEPELTPAPETTGTDGASFYPLLARQKKARKYDIRLTWQKIDGATSYTIYGNTCAKHNELVKIETTTETETTFTGLKKGTYYKYIVVANGVKDGTVKSCEVHVATSGGKFGNASSVKLSKTAVTLSVKKTSTIKATVTDDGNVDIHRELSYESTDPSIAKVNKNGKITAVSEGTCYVYVYAQNGKYNRVKVTVKPLAISATVTFKVKNGSWNDGTKAAKKVTLKGYEGDELKLSGDQIPAVGKKPASDYKAGAWDVTPDTKTAVTGKVTYTYTYVKEEAVPGPSKSEKAKIDLDAGLKVTWSRSPNKITVKFGKVSNATSYEVYAAYGVSGSLKKIAAVSGRSVNITKLNGKSLNRKKIVRIQVIAKKGGTQLAKSIMAFAAGPQNKYTNAKSVTLTKSSFTLKKGSTAKLSAEAAVQDGSRQLLPDSFVAKFRYATSNKNVAAVDKDGKITAKGRGECLVYVYAANGMAKSVKVVVK